MRLLLTTCFLFSAYVVCAQLKIQGRVVDKETNKPLAGASVYLSHSTRGTVSNDNGEFLLTHLLPGRYELVVSSINYENYIITVQAGESNDSLKIFAKPVASLLKEVVVEPYDIDGWKRWRDMFNALFIGTTQLGSHCILQNPEVVKFKYNSTNNKVRAFADQKLIIENKDLGYKITYLLSKFEMDFKNSVFVIKGYPLFEDLSPKNEKMLSKWNKLRAEAYLGSLKHFIRSLYLNKLGEEGFEIKKVKLITQEELARVNLILKTKYDPEDSLAAGIAKKNKDSMSYYIAVRNVGNPNRLLLLNDLVGRDSIVYKLDNPDVMAMDFSGILQVTYLKKRNPAAYTRTSSSIRSNDFERTLINLRTEEPVYIYSNGSYYNGLDLITDGYWAWFEKVSTMLPSDYQPEH